MARSQQENASQPPNGPPTALRRVTWASAFLAFVVYSITAAPTAYWLDSSELAAAGFELGIPHPPGHPLFVLLAKAATLIPVGSVAYRIHLLCAGLLAASVGISWRLIHAMWGPRSWLATALVLPSLILCTPLWFHGVRAEVYPLNALLSVIIVILAVELHQKTDLPRLILLAFVTGLGACNHHYLIALLGPGVLFLVATEQHNRRLLFRRFHLFVAALVCGLTPYLLLPIRAGAFTTVRWGDPSTPGGFLWLVSARAFHKSAARGSAADPAQVFSNFGQFLDHNLGWILVALAAIGLVLVLLRSWKLGLGLGVIILLNWFSQALLDFDPLNPDVAGYFIPSIILLALLAVGAIDAGLKRARGTSLIIRLATTTFLAGICLISALTVSVGAPRSSDLSDERATSVFADEMYAFAGTGAVLIPTYFETSFNLWYQDVVAGRRPDVAVINRLFRTYPGYDEYIEHRYPNLTPLLAVAGIGGGLDTAWLLQAASQRTILMELLPPDEELETPAVRRIREQLLPAGLMLQLSPIPIPHLAYPQELVDSDLRFWAVLYERLGEPAFETERNLAWIHYNRARFLLSQGRPEAAVHHLDRALDIFPNDVDLNELISVAAEMRSERDR